MKTPLRSATEMFAVGPAVVCFTDVLLLPSQ